MARQRVYGTDPSKKEFEAYMDFSGGLNSEISNERLRDNEFPVMENVDLSGRSSARMRSGRSLVLTQTGNAQGGFFFYRIGQAKPDMILAISGRLYVKPTGSSTSTEIPIMDGSTAFTFQTTVPIEAVQYRTSMYVATGTKLVVITYSTESSIWTANVVVPYTPTPMEAIYIGTNGLAADPSAYVQDGTSTALQVIGIKPSKRTGTANTSISLTAYVNKPSSITSVEYKWEYKKHDATTFTFGTDWTSTKTYTFITVEPGEWDIQVTARDASVTTTTSVYVLTGYVVNQVEDTANTTLPVGGIQTCTKILLHWERLLLYGDTQNPFQLYISDLENPAYFPTTNTINFDTGKQEALQVGVRFQNMLVFFTKTTIQTLTGQAPEDYRRSLIHDGIGCTAPWTAKVVGNVILFRSAEGVFRLRPNQYNLENLNVDRVDHQIRSELPDDSDACAVVYDNQYWICDPSASCIYRFYYETGVWVKDTSTKLAFRQFMHYGEDVYNISKTGQLYKHNKSVYTDASEVYYMIVETKYLDLSASFNYKKLKRMYVLARHFSHSVDLYLKVFSDSRIALTPDSGYASVDESDDNTVEWNTTTTPNMHFYTGTTFGTWVLGASPFGDVTLSVQRTSVRGKCRRVKVRFEYRGGEQCELFGFGLEFKLKKP